MTFSPSATAPAMRLAFHADSYQPGTRHRPHRHDELHFSLVLSGRVMETVRGRTEIASATSVVAKDAGVIHANDFGIDGAMIHPLRLFAGTYANPYYGEITFSVQDGRLAYRWGALYGPVEIFDASQDQMRLEVAGSGTVARFTFGDAGSASAVVIQGVTLSRR